MRLLTLLAIALPLAACAADPANGTGGDVGDPQAFTSGADTADDTCSLSRDQILAGAKVADRQRAITRGWTWFDQNVPYSQSDSFEGYRTDCSGFVSMSWELGNSLTTEDFDSDNDSSSTLDSYDDLFPGDALVRRVDGEGHIMMFLAWNDAQKSTACVIEDRSTDLDMQFHVRDVSELTSDGYHPIRANKFQDDTPAPGGAGGDDAAPTAAPSASGDTDQCFLQCIQPSPNANQYVQCSMKCQDQTCDDTCFNQACGKTASACDTALKRCDQQCGAAQ